MRALALCAVLASCGGPHVQRARVEGPAPAATPALELRPAAKAYDVDIARSTFAIYGADVFGGEHRMSFKSWSARVDIDDAPRIHASIDTASVEVETAGAAGVVRRHLLEVETFPSATLEATLARTSGPPAEHAVTGMAELHGVKKTLRFVGTLRQEGEAYRFTTEFVLSRKAFGIRYGPAEPFLRNDVRIVIDAYAVPAP